MKVLFFLSILSTTLNAQSLNSKVNIEAPLFENHFRDIIKTERNYKVLGNENLISIENRHLVLNNKELKLDSVRIFNTDGQLVSSSKSLYGLKKGTYIVFLHPVNSDTIQQTIVIE